MQNDSDHSRDLVRKSLSDIKGAIHDGTRRSIINQTLKEEEELTIYKNRFNSSFKEFKHFHKKNIKIEKLLTQYFLIDEANHIIIFSHDSQNNIMFCKFVLNCHSVYAVFMEKYEPLKHFMPLHFIQVG